MLVFKKKYNWNDKTCINSKNLGDNSISLPIYARLKNQIKFLFVIKSVNFSKL